MDMEEYKSIMWKATNDSIENLILGCVDLLSSEEKFNQAIGDVFDQWPNSCECQFTNKASNQIAWLGQAACALSVKSPEYVTRLAWRELTETQQTDANLVAKLFIESWINAYNGVNNAQKIFAF